MEETAMNGEGRRVVTFSRSWVWALDAAPVKIKIWLQYGESPVVTCVTSRRDACRVVPSSARGWRERKETTRTERDGVWLRLA